MVRTSGTTVQAEEVGIVLVVLFLWAAAIALFINRWGKIRAMEPYNPYVEVTAPPPIQPPIQPSNQVSISCILSRFLRVFKTVLLPLDYKNGTNR